jgi:hypothetical protein
MTRKISMFFATLIVVAHAIIPHQHKAQLKIALHECFFSDSGDKDSPNIFERLSDIIKHVNLGEKHLENFRTPTHKYESLSIAIFDVPEVVSIPDPKQKVPEKISHSFYYPPKYFSTQNWVSCGLRAPPSL